MESVHVDILDDVVTQLISMGYNAQSVSINKNNIAKRGIIIKDEEHKATPIVFEESLASRSVDEMAIEVLELNALYRSFTDTDDLETVNIDKNYILKNSRLAVCRLDWNEEMLNGIPYRIIGESDLAAFVKCNVSYHMVFKVTTDLLIAYGLSFEELFDVALENDNYICTNISDLINVNLLDAKDIKMLVVTNEEGSCGAGTICDNYILKEALKRLGCERMLIIPSSVHEVICIPDDGEITTVLTIAKMIADVNQFCLKPEDVLSDHPYIFDGEVVRNS